MPAGLEHSLLIAKALADRSRLLLLKALESGALCAEEMAGLLDLSPSTVSFHIKKLTDAGLIITSREQYYTVCALSPSVLDMPIRALLDFGPPAHAAPARVDSRRREVQKVVDTFFVDGELRKMPAQRWKREIVLERLAALFPPGTYSEKEVNRRLNQVYSDHCLARRLLVDEGFFTRSQGVYARVDRPASRGETGPASLPGTTTGDRRRRDSNSGDKKMNSDKKIKREEYKRADKTAGIFRITNVATGKVLLGSALNLHGPLNRMEFELQMGCHRNRALQEDYNRYGKDAFRFEVVEEVKASKDPEFNVESELEKLEELHKATLDRGNVYNETDDIRVLRLRRRAPAQPQ